jgi:hypothetical protein
VNSEHVQASEVELPADELKEPLATDSAMSWSKQHTTVRRCGDHNEHSLQNHNAHCTAEEEGTHKHASPTTRPPRNKK